MSGLTKKTQPRNLRTYHVGKSWSFEMLLRRFTRHKILSCREGKQNLHECKQIRACEPHFSVEDLVTFPEAHQYCWVEVSYTQIYIYLYIYIQYTHKKYLRGLVPLNGKLFISFFDGTSKMLPQGKVGLN